MCKEIALELIGVRACVSTVFFSLHFLFSIMQPAPGRFGPQPLIPPSLPTSLRASQCPPPLPPLDFRAEEFGDGGSQVAFFSQLNTCDKSVDLKEEGGGGAESKFSLAALGCNLGIIGS